MAGLYVERRVFRGRPVNVVTCQRCGEFWHLRGSRAEKRAGFAILKGTHFCDLDRPAQFALLAPPDAVA